MSPYLPLDRKANLQLCTSDGCARWWPKFLFLNTLTPPSFSSCSSSTTSIRPLSGKCPYCRGITTKPTQYYLGGMKGPKEPGYDFPANMPLQRKNCEERGVGKRMLEEGEGVETSRAGKVRKVQQLTPITPMNNIVETAVTKRKDCATAHSPSPTPQDLNLQSLLSKTSSLYSSWNLCNGDIPTHRSPEHLLHTNNHRTLVSSIPNLELSIQKAKQDLADAETHLQTRKTLWKALNDAAETAGLTEQRDLEIKEEWMGVAHKHVQLGWEEHNRKNGVLVLAERDLEVVKRDVQDARRIVEEIEEERRQLKAFGQVFGGELAVSKGGGGV